MTCCKEGSHGHGDRRSVRSGGPREVRLPGGGRSGYLRVPVRLRHGRHFGALLFIKSCCWWTAWVRPISLGCTRPLVWPHGSFVIGWFPKPKAARSRRSTSNGNENC